MRIKVGVKPSSVRLPNISHMPTDEIQNSPPSMACTAAKYKELVQLNGRHQATTACDAHAASPGTQHPAQPRTHTQSIQNANSRSPGIVLTAEGRNSNPNESETPVSTNQASLQASPIIDPLA